MNTPEYRIVTSDNIEAIFELDIIPELECFDGHFDNHPVLPGVAQVTFAMRIAEHHFGIKNQFAGMEAVKFQSIITPPNKVLLWLKYDADKSKIHFKYFKESANYSSGRILV
ncbi:MAG: hypothetical protein HWE16_09600 [Gammaproteobacteria bacterium]|nr:hypothetical protein [Gammaproteobacteria bacterium]